ncbi:high-affinity lysophosphatidic acid receptor-like [Tachypleus tridentatus]|uniref:high-affinity lysophosphatidic acid receptor-like n=1 Tax=Tachypleus tridentatus TaxID=6853 RepID=UPI003FCF5DAE
MLSKSLSSAISNITESDVHFEGDFTVEQRIFFSGMFIFIIFVSIPGNSIVCFIVYQSPPMRSAINFLLATMAFCDMLTGALIIPCDLATLLINRWPFGSTFCCVHGFLQSLLMIESVTVLLLISIDRFMIIVQKRDKLNTRHASFLLLVSWIYSLLASFPPLVGGSRYVYNSGQTHCRLGPVLSLVDTFYMYIHFCTFYLIPFVSMTFSYVYILNTVRRTAIRIGNQPGNSSILTANGSVKRYSITTARRPQHLRIDLRFKTRTFTTILILFIGFFICRTPFSLATFTWSYKNITPSYDYLYVVWFLYINTILNPVIYAWKIKKFREACWDIFPNCWRYLPGIPKRARRRVNPSAIYRIHTSRMNKSSV